MRPFGGLVPFEEALERLLAAVPPLDEAEGVAVAEAVGRVAAETLTAKEPVPTFARSMMDGFAVRAADVAGATTDRPVRLRVAGVVHAGTQAGPVEPGGCCQIATGGPLPRGADAVVAVEQTHRVSADLVEVRSGVEAGGHVAAAGSDFGAGDVAVRRGQVCTPAIVGAVASLGLGRTWVLRKPRVAVWGSGDEVRPAGEALLFGQVHDSNGPTLGALVAQHGGVARLHGALRDDPAALAAAFDARGVDVVLITGGTSVGEKDLVARAIADRAEVLFHGIAVKPGKPVLAARMGRTLVVGLPGNPASCLMMGYALVVPALRRLAGLPPWEPLEVDTTLAAAEQSPRDKRQFLPVRLDAEERAVPAFRGSGAISSLSAADGWIEIPAGVTHLAEGADVVVRFFA
jgi:molybdenum cofactor synthesis domain-containing protein